MRRAFTAAAIACAMPPGMVWAGAAWAGTVWAGTAWAGTAWGEEVCQAPDEVAGTVTPLPRVAEALKPGGVLRVLAIGSASIFGPDASLSPGTVTSQVLGRAPLSEAKPGPAAAASEHAFPWQMAKALREAVPGLSVQVELRGGRGAMASEMLGMMRAALEHGQYQLVLWQTGTVEAVRNSSPSDFAEALSDGAEAVEAAGANLVLIDPQYSRFLQANSNLDPYVLDLQQTAAMAGVMLFHRFDLMHAWAEEGRLDLEHAPKADRKRVAEALHACVGQHLARMILAAARS